MVRFVAGLIPPWAWTALLAIALAFSFGSGWRVRDLSARAADAQRLVDHHEAARQAEAIEREREHVANVKAQEVRDEHQRDMAKVQAAANRALGELGRLRYAADAIASSAACEAPNPASRIDGPTLLGQLLGHCAASLQALAAEADATEARLAGLQDWVGKVHEGR